MLWGDVLHAVLELLSGTCMTGPLTILCSKILIMLMVVSLFHYDFARMSPGVARFSFLWLDSQ